MSCETNPNKVARAATFSGAPRRVMKASYYISLASAGLGLLTNSPVGAWLSENASRWRRERQSFDAYFEKPSWVGKVFEYGALAAPVVGLASALYAARQLGARKKQVTKFVLLDEDGREIGWTYDRNDAEKTRDRNKQAGHNVVVVEVAQRVDHGEIQAAVKQANELRDQR